MPGAYELQDLRPPQPTLEGDARFVGWNCKVPRWQLPPGFYPRAENKRAHRGTLEDREGTTTPVFANSFAAGTLLGAGPFTNVNGREILLLATRNQVIGVRSGSIAIDIDCAVDPSGNIKFCPQFGKVLMHSDDSSVAPQEWDGLSADGFVALDQSGVDESLGIVAMPNVPWSIRCRISPGSLRRPL
jgi:hypothetical protein